MHARGRKGDGGKLDIICNIRSDTNGWNTVLSNSLMSFWRFFIFLEHVIRKALIGTCEILSLQDTVLYPGRRKWQSNPALLPGKSHRQRSLVGYSLWGHKESDMTERLHSVSIFFNVFLFEFI